MTARSELRRIVTNDPVAAVHRLAELEAALQGLKEAASAIVARHGGYHPMGSWQSPGHDVIRAEWQALYTALEEADDGG
jgi:hypothetical protein